MVAYRGEMWWFGGSTGFPFLGNDFFREAGDAFACHVIDNPDIDR